MRQRIITGVIGGALVLGFVYLGGFFFNLLVFVIALGAFYEYVVMNRDKPYAPHVILGYILTFILIFFNLWEMKFVFHLDVLWFITFLLLFLAVLTKNRVSLRRLSYIVIGAVYIGLGFHYMVLVRGMEGGLMLTYWVIGVIWGTDSGAYFGGRWFGRHKLWPSISPKKTWEGAIAGTLVAVLLAYVLATFLHLPYRAGSLLLTTLLVSIGGQIGDLIESAIKRSLGAKDSGDILPGHGGFFDRFDSMIVAFPVFVWAMRYLEPFLLY